VGSAAEKTYATTDAFVAGVESVDNEGLNVERWEEDVKRRSQKIHVKSDKEIKRAVEDALRFDPRVTEFKIEVNVDKGRVTLNGVVDNLKAKRAARQDAENTIGVWRVKNFIKVRPLTTLTDQEIKNNVKEALRWNTVVDAENLTVKVENKKAHLYGTVNTFYEKDQAEQTAAGVSGVVDVANYIKANAEWEWKDDQAIKDDVEDELFWSLYVDSDDIEVSVQDGVVSLKGTVSSWSELDAAIKNAFEGGAKSVTSYLKIKQAPGYEPVTHYRHYYQWTY
jgi:osmotically-inducible protein OsmY